MNTAASTLLGFLRDGPALRCRRFIPEQLRKLGLGCAGGAVIGATWQFLSHDHKIAAFLQRSWLGLRYGSDPEGSTAYRAEVAIFAVGITLVAFLPGLAWIGRFARSWWSGITSIVWVFATSSTLVCLEYPPVRTRSSAALWLTSFLTLLAAEFWRKEARPYQCVTRDLQLGIPTRVAGFSSELRWEARADGDPITDFASDFIGRTALVEQLARYALEGRTPILALHGGLGDGKSSVLNLLGKAIEPHAIVVSFSAWLPGSEATLAADLFRDIVTECRKCVNVPQLRKQTRAFARMMSGSMNFLGGIKELVPVQSQREEIQELRNTISRVPKRVVVLLDEIDRMQRDELIVLLKILRGANTIPNVTFVCAFSEAEVKKQLERDGSLAHDYLEKFFPVSVTLSPPSPDLVGRCFRAELQGRLLQQGWFTDEEEVKPFATLLENAWDDGLAPVCTNLRKAGLLINDVLASGELITREVNPLDLVLVETIRRFAPSIHRTVRTHGVLLTDAEKSGYFDPEKDATEFFKQLNRDIEACPEAKTIKVLLCWLFPEYAEKGCDRRAQIMSASRRRVEPGAADGEKRIRDRYYFPIYFRAAVPEDMFSESELSQVLSKLKSAATNEATETVFRAELNSLPVGHPKRSDFLWKLARGAEGFKADAAERLAYVAAECASSYAYDVVNFGEAAYALNMVFVAAKLAADRQRVLEGAMARASNDTFAVRILDFTEHRDNNKILTDYSGIDIPKLKLAFIRRMQTRYGITSSTGPPDIGQADWWAFRQWVENSPEDTLAEQAFWSRFIGSSRKRLAQAANFIYPANVYWEQDPRPTVGALIPMAVLAQFLENRCSSDEELDPEENGALNRIQDLIAGKYRLGPHLGAALDQH